MVFYLADNNLFYVSRPIGHADGKDVSTMTFSAVLFAIGLKLPAPPSPSESPPPVADIDFLTIPLKNIAGLELHTSDATSFAQTQSTRVRVQAPRHVHADSQNVERIESVPSQPFPHLGAGPLGAGPWLRLNSGHDNASEDRTIIITVGPFVSRGRLWHTFKATLSGAWEDLSARHDLKIQWAAPSSSSRTSTEGTPVTPAPSLKPAKSTSRADSSDFAHADTRCGPSLCSEVQCCGVGQRHCCRPRGRYP